MSREHEKDLLKWFEETPDDQVDSWEVGLGEKILRLQEDQLSKDDFNALQNQLLTEPRATQYYVEFIQTSTELHFLLSKKQQFISPQTLLSI